MDAETHNGVGSEVSSALRDLASSLLRVARLEARLEARRLILAVTTAVVALCLLTSGLVILGVAAAWGVAAYTSWPAALAVVGLATVVIAGLVVWLGARPLRKNPPFPNTTKLLSSGQGDREALQRQDSLPAARKLSLQPVRK